jgi:hypothetical protein
MVTVDSKMGATSGAETVYSFRAPEFTPVILVGFKLLNC